MPTGFRESRVGGWAARWAFILPWLVLSVESSEGGVLPGSWRGPITFIAGLVAGAGWQLLHPRDPVVRLTGFPMIITILAVLVGSSEIPDRGAEVATSFAAMLGVAVGVLGAHHQFAARDLPTTDLRTRPTTRR